MTLTDVARLDLGDRIRKVAKQADRELIQASLLSPVLEGGDSLEDDVSCYLIAENLEKLSGGLPLFSNPSPESAHGDYPIGIVEGTDPELIFGLREEERIRHVIIPGSTGAGKTNTVFVILKQDMRRSKPFIVFDWKRNFRDCVNLPEAMGKEILIFTVGRELCPFHFNPLIPPRGTSPSVWLGKLIEIMAHAFFLGEGVIYILSKALDQVYSDFGVYQGNGSWPTFRDVLRFLENYDCKGRETQWLASALRAVSMLCFGELDRILNVAHYPMDRLLERNIILELDALTDTAKVFFTEAFLLWLHHFRIAQGKRETFRHTCVIEEAHHILSKKLQMISGTETITDMIIREIRELGESLIIVDQNPSLLSIPTLGNTYATICMNLKERNDVNLMASCLNLDYNDKDILTKLEVGQAVIKLQGRHTDPFLIRIPKVEMKKGAITDEQVRLRMAGFYKELHETTPKTSSPLETVRITTGNRKGEKEEKGKLQNRQTRQQTAELENSKENELIDGLSKQELELLADIHENPLSKVGDRYKRLRIDEAKGNRARQLLEAKGLIEAVNLPTLRAKGYWGKALELTRTGRAALASLNVDLPDEISRRKGSLIHQHYLSLIAKKLEQAGHEVGIEHPLGNGETADLLIDGKTAVEFERSDRHTLQNVRKNLAKHFKVVIVAETSALMQRISALLAKNSLEESVTLMELKDFGKGPDLIPFPFSQFPARTKLMPAKSSRFQEKGSKTTDRQAKEETLL